MSVLCYYKVKNILEEPIATCNSQSEKHSRGTNYDLQFAK